jgi:hypothetical protein
MSSRFGRTYSANSSGTPSASNSFLAVHASFIASSYTALARGFDAMSRGVM